MCVRIHDVMTLSCLAVDGKDSCGVFSLGAV